MANWDKIFLLFLYTYIYSSNTPSNSIEWILMNNYVYIYVGNQIKDEKEFESF